MLVKAIPVELGYGPLMLDKVCRELGLHQRRLWLLETGRVLDHGRGKRGTFWGFGGNSRHRNSGNKEDLSEPHCCVGMSEVNRIFMEKTAEVKSRC